MTLSEDAPTLGAGAVKGANLPGSSDFNASMALQYDFILASHNSFARIDYSYIGEYYSTFDESTAAIGGYGQTNLSLGVDFESISANIFVNNLTNENGLTWVESNLSALSDSVRGYQMRPRTIGLNLSYNF